MKTMPRTGGRRCRGLDAPPAADLSLDAVYAHDASLATDFGLIVMRPGKPNRIPEGRNQSSFCTRLGVPTLAKIVAPGATEAGDILWLEEKVEENVAGTDQTTCLSVTATAPTPSALGSCVACSPPRAPTSFLAASLRPRPLRLSAPDVSDQPARRADRPVDLPWLAVETVETAVRAATASSPVDSSERDALACNVLALGGNRLLALPKRARPTPASAAPASTSAPSPAANLRQRRPRPHLSDPPPAARG